MGLRTMRLRLFALIATTALLGCFGKKTPPPRLAPVPGPGDPVGYVAYKFTNKTGWKVRVTLEDSAMKDLAVVDLDRPGQEVHVSALLKPSDAPLPDEDAFADPPTVIRIRPGTWRVQALEAGNGKKVERDAGSGETFKVEEGQLTYIGDIRPKISTLVVTWSFSFETVDGYNRQMQGILGRIPVRRQPINLK